MHNKRNRLIGLSILLCLLLTFFSGTGFAKAITSFTIEQSTQYSNTASVTLYISAEDANRMSFSCNASSWSDYIAYAVTASFDLNSGSYGCTPAEGLRTVYTKVEYTDGNYSDGTHNDTITLDFTPPQITSFSPATEVSNGNGALGQAISIGLSDDYNLARISIALSRGGTTLYSGSTTKCSITGLTSTCAFTDYSFDRGASYTYSYTVYDEAGNSKSDSNIIAFTDSIAPAKPLRLWGIDYNTTIVLYWDGNSERDFNKFAVYRSTISDFDANSSYFVSFADTNSYTNLGLDENTLYYYKIKAIDWTGNYSEPSDQNYFTSDFNTLTTPIITRTDKPCISNAWCVFNNPTLQISGVNNGKYSWILTTSTSTLPSDCNYYSDCNALSSVSISGLPEGTVYFKIKTCKPNGCSPVSTYTIKTDYTSPSAPTNVAVTVTGDNNVNVSWGAASDSLSGIYQYYVYRSTTKGFSANDNYLLYYVPAATLSYRDLTAVKGTTYYYKVLSRDYAGNYSPDSNSPSIQTGSVQSTVDTNISLQIKNYLNADINYFNKAMDFNLFLIFSKTVNKVNISKTINSAERQNIVSERDNISSYTGVITTSASYSTIRIDANAYTGTGYLTAFKILYYDSSPPTISFKNILENQKIAHDSNVIIDANDNFFIKNIEVFLDNNKIGVAVKKDSNWVFTLKPEHGSGIKKLKAIVFDGADNFSSIEANILIWDKNTTQALSTEEKKDVADSIKTTEDKINELQAFLNQKQIILNPNQSTVKQEADALLQEARSLADTNAELSKQKSLAALNRYASILAQITNEYLAKNPASSGINFELIGAIVVVLVIIAAGIFLFIRSKMNPPEKEYPLPMNIDRMIAQIK